MLAERRFNSSQACDKVGMMRRLLISVVIASYEEPEEFLRECFQSLLAQTFSDWEGIVVDDASTRGDVERVVAEMGDSRLKVIKHSHNRGLGAARNTGISAAQTPLIALLDADDRLHPEFLEATFHALRDHPDADWVVVDWEVFGTRNEVWPIPVDRSVTCPAHSPYVGAGTLMRKSVWERVGGYAEEEALRGGEDWDFWIGVAELSLRPHRISQPLYLYRQHTKAMSVTAKPYNEHIIRRAIYRRHKSAFESLGLDCPWCRSPKTRIAAFLAQGFLVSSSASLNQGERLRAIRMAIHALTLQPGNPAILRHLARCFRV